MERNSCEWIESRVVLAIDYLQYCCIPHSGNKGYVHMVPYKGGDLPVEAIREARRSLIEDNNTPGKDTPCTGCHFLRKKDWDAERKSQALFDTVYIANFTICNLRCRYCFVYINEAEERPDVDYDPLPVFRQMLEEGHLERGAYVEWGGGEPTILPSWPALQALFKEYGLRQQVHTSAVKFAPELEEGLRSGYLQAVTSVDAGTRETYLKVKGRDRHEVVWQNVARYAATGGNMALKYILRHDNSDANNVHTFVEHCRTAGIKRLAITPDMREIAQRTVSEETIYAFALMLHEAKKHGIEAAIHEEYVKPEDMRMLTKYAPLVVNGWRYRVHLAKRGLAKRLAHARSARVRRSVRTREAIQLARRMHRRGTGLVHPFQLLPGIQEASFQQQRSRLTELLEYQTKNPHPELVGQLKAIVEHKLVPGQRSKNGRTVVLGVTDDSWTTDGKPAYILADAQGQAEPLVQEVWLACFASAHDLPLRVTIADGLGKELQYLFLSPERVRMELPAVPAGETTLFSVRTDKTWSKPDFADRTLGVQITTRMKL